MVSSMPCGAEMQLIPPGFHDLFRQSGGIDEEDFVTLRLKFDTRTVWHCESQFGAGPQARPPGLLANQQASGLAS
jgi:hypothetical protein